MESADLSNADGSARSLRRPRQGEWDIVVDSIPARRSLGLREIWAYRELVYFLTWRDIKARYKQAIFGIGWAVLQPLATTLVFTLVFSLLARIPSDGIPYPIFVLTAMVPWTYFARSVERASNSVVDSANLFTKVYFPRMILTLSAVLSGLVDFAMSLILLLGLMAYFHVGPTLRVAAIPAIIALAIITALGVGLLMSALNVSYRDVKHITPFMLQIWMFATPIIYPVSLVPEQLRFLYSLNPMVAVVEGFRWALLGQPSLLGSTVLVSVLVAITSLVVGALYFKNSEDWFADVV